MNLSTYKKIIIFGGSFDPPHYAHIELPQLVRKAVNADLVLYIPTGRAPHKLEKIQTPSKHRLEMLRLALQDIPHTMISTIEIDRENDGRPSYTIDTLRALKQSISPDTTLRLLFGADQLRIFDKWYHHEEIEQLAEPIVMVRPPESRMKLLAGLKESDRMKWSKRIVELPVMDISSTQVRDDIQNGNTSLEQIPPHVVDYIHTHQLYR